MPESKQNCWEYKKCGREPGGEKAEELGICPAASDSSYDGINKGKKGGRICWAVAGTFCEGSVQGTFADKRESCTKCEFFKLVRINEGLAKQNKKFLRFLFREDGTSLIEDMTYRYIKAGERFILQGEIEEVAYVIQTGSCLAVLEKDGEFHPSNHYGEGDIVGGTGLLTGERRNASVDAETDLKVWVITRSQFEEMAKKDSGALEFLTELIANRFDSKRPTAYRSIGKYISTEIIGRGGYSIVYKGAHSVLNLPVAIKMLRHHMAMDHGFLDNFRNEAKTIAGLNHENIVKIYDIEERYKTVFIIMELIEGTSLRDMLDNLKILPPHLATKYLIQICAGLDYAHQNNIIHRDINPTNIIILGEDRLKILDFGLSCHIGTEDFASTGTVYYIAPEQISGEAVGRQADIYSLGIMAYEMVTGRRPFPEDDLWELKKIHLSRDIPDPGEIIPKLPEKLRDFIVKAGRRDPGERYASAKDALNDLNSLAEVYGIQQNNHISFEKQKMTNLMLIYNENMQLELSKLVDEFSARAQEIGVVLKVADFQDT
jgi:serine/threonine protein kinase